MYLHDFFFFFRLKSVSIFRLPFYVSDSYPTLILWLISKGLKYLCGDLRDQKKICPINLIYSLNTVLPLLHLFSRMGFKNANILYQIPKVRASELQENSRIGNNIQKNGEVLSQSVAVPF